MDWTVQLIKKQPKLKPLHLDCTLEKNTTNSICSIGTLYKKYKPPQPNP